MLEERALRLLRRLEPKVIRVDEVHHLLSGSAREQRRSLNLLKFIANELHVCMVAIGTADARIAIQTDLQVASRFEPCHLPRWSSTEESRGFLAGFLKGLPLARAVRRHGSRGGSPAADAKWRDHGTDHADPGAGSGDGDPQGNRIHQRVGAGPRQPRFGPVASASRRMLPLPIVPPAAEGELLGSWIQRTASVYDLSAH